MSRYRFRILEYCEVMSSACGYRSKVKQGTQALALWLCLTTDVLLDNLGEVRSRLWRRLRAIGVTWF
ncbi:hypothetical protein QUB43_05535 [Microcoleus sp. A6-D4]